MFMLLLGVVSLGLWLQADSLKTLTVRIYPRTTFKLPHKVNYYLLVTVLVLESGTL